MNSELYNNVYLVPKDIVNSINTAIYKYPDSNGIKRAKNIVKNGKITYQNLKRLKNFFKSNGDGSEFELAGGGLMKSYIDKTLGSERDRVENSTENKRDFAPQSNNGIKPQSVNMVSSIHEDVDSEIETEGLDRNAVAVIIDSDKRVLLLKRSNYEDQWQPNKWSLPGGKIEEGETPVDGLKREVEEEVGIKIEKFSEKIVIQRSSNSVEHIFTVKYDGKPEDIDIDFENNGFGWFTYPEMRYLNTVPNLTDYIRMSITNYDE